jgi:hypothetical protein
MISMTAPAAGTRRFLQNYDQYLPDNLKGRDKDFFVYTTEFLPLAAGATTTNAINTQADSDFLVLAGVRTVFNTDNTTLVASPPALVTISDAGAGRSFMDRAVHLENLFGTAQLPAFWPYPKFWSGGSSIAVTLQNLDGANGRNYRLSFLGFKVF